MLLAVRLSNQLLLAKILISAKFVGSFCKNEEILISGFLIDFVSGPVSSGFTSAVALIIVTSQLKDILGIAAKGSTFIQLWQSIADGVHETSVWDAVLGVTCIAFLLILRVIKKLFCN